MRTTKPGQKRWARVLLAAATVVAATVAHAADDSRWQALADRVFTPVTPNAEMPHALVPNSMTEGAHGFLWMAGQVGLLRWDGYEYRDYPASALPDGVQDVDVWTLYRDARQTLWAGTKSNGLVRYDPVQDRLVCVGLVSARCGTEEVWSIADDGAGGIWVATSTGLFRLDGSGRRIAQFHAVPGQPNSLPDDEVFAVLRDREGVLWVGTSHGLVRSRDDGREFTAVALDGRAAPAVSRLMEDGEGRLWIGTRTDGAFVIGANRGPARIVGDTAPRGPTGSAPDITSLLEIAPDHIWLATDGSGIVEVDAATMHTQRIAHDPFVPNSLDSDAVMSLYRDRSGLVWVSTESGLSQYNPGRGIMTMFGHGTRQDGLPGEGVLAVYAAPDDSLWIGVQGGGFIVFYADGRRAKGLPDHNVYTISPAPSGGMLLGTDGGLFMADASGEHVTHLTVPQLGPKVHTLQTVDGSVWLGGWDGGLWQLHIDAAGAVRVLRYETAPRLTNPVVDAVTRMRDGRLAIGTDNGMNILDPASNTIERITSDPTDPLGLTAGLVGAIATDRQGRLWIGTQNGLDMLQGHDAAGKPRFRHITVADGLPNASIDSLEVDHLGFIWASTDKGLAVVDPSDFTVRALQRGDGLAISNYWSDSSTQTRDGDLMFGGIGGMTIVRPDSIMRRHYRPPVVFTAATVGGASVPVSPGNGGVLVVPAGTHSVEVEFAALDYSAPAHNHYRYRLDGFDTNWVDTDAAHREAAYTNLPPGDYLLRVRGSSRDGEWSDPETTLRIHVLPAWYQTLWFHVAAAVGAVLTMAALLRGWTAILRRRQRELERQVADRTTELSVSKMQLQHANSALEMRVAERTQALVERTAALEASDARFRAWFNNAEDAVFVVQVEPDGRFVYEAVNAAVERLFGVAADRYPGHEPGQVLSAEEAAAVLSHYREAAKGEPIQFESRINGSGVERLVDSWIVPLRNPVTGRVERLIGAARDITERRALEARLAQAQKLQALGGLAGGIAHDFNNILQAVAGAAMLIEQLPEDLAKIQRLARSTFAAAERGTSITKRLLAFARSDEFRVEAVPTAEILGGVAEVLSSTLGATIKVRTELGPGLPPLWADRGQFETALVNLGTNARDAMPGGGILTISAEAELVRDGIDHPAGLTAGAYVRIDVSDTGCGMDAATLARVVEPFFTTKPTGQGTGLGLALVKGFTEQSGGGMTIESAPGAGTIVSLWLRQAATEAVYRPLVPPRRRPAGAAPARILVVDDDDLVRETMAEQLAAGGFVVTTAANGTDALAIIQNAGAPDVMVCDLSMPGINGVDTIKRARALAPQMPCFLLTGYAGGRGALETGKDYTLLRKPISAGALIAHIDSALAAMRI